MQLLPFQNAVRGCEPASSPATALLTLDDPCWSARQLATAGCCAGAVSCLQVAGGDQQLQADCMHLHSYAFYWTFGGTYTSQSESQPACVSAVSYDRATAWAGNQSVPAGDLVHTRSFGPFTDSDQSQLWRQINDCLDGLCGKTVVEQLLEKGHNELLAQVLSAFPAAISHILHCVPAAPAM